MTIIDYITIILIVLSIISCFRLVWKLDATSIDTIWHFIAKLVVWFIAMTVFWTLWLIEFYI